MKDKRMYVERRPDGDYAVRRANSERASDVLPTQRQAIERAQESAQAVGLTLKECVTLPAALRTSGAELSYTHTTKNCGEGWVEPFAKPITIQQLRLMGIASLHPSYALGTCLLPPVAPRISAFSRNGFPCSRNPLF